MLADAKGLNHLLAAFLHVLALSFELVGSLSRDLGARPHGTDADLSTFCKVEHVLRLLGDLV